MSRVTVTPTVAADPVTYEGNVTPTYDSDGYLTVEEAGKVRAVWAPGQWQHADAELDAGA